jgi:hypothetical protein
MVMWDQKEGAVSLEGIGVAARMRGLPGARPHLAYLNGPTGHIAILKTAVDQQIPVSSSFNV